MSITKSLHSISQSGLVVQNRCCWVKSVSLKGPGDGYAVLHGGRVVLALNGR